jgi:hypothetical protein
MRRREFFKIIAGSALAWSRAAQAQQQGERVRRVGVMMARAAADAETTEDVGAFAQGLAELGWTIGRNVRIEYRYSGGDPETFRKYAKEMSPRGAALSYGAIGNVVSRHTVAELGIRITTHDTRDAAATTWAIALPSQIGISRDLLSHSDLRTTGKHYNRAKGVEASRAYSTILQIKKYGGRR